VETALLAQQLGTKAIIIIEKLHEIDLVLQAAKKVLRITAVCLYVRLCLACLICNLTEGCALFAS
jgi:arginine decarboxylase-like protein